MPKERNCLFLSQVEQVFYVLCPKLDFEDWAICVSTTSRSQKVVQLRKDLDEENIKDLL